jgi:hypothetical protein
MTMEWKTMVNDKNIFLSRFRIFLIKGLHYQYPNHDPEFFNGHSPNEQIFHQSNGDNQTSTGKNFVFLFKVIKADEFDNIK